MVKDLDIRLRICRDTKRLQQKDVADKTGIGKSSLSTYETGDVTPSLENLIVLADFYNVSLDYLCGRETDCVIRTDDLSQSQIEGLLRIANELRENSK